MEQFYVEIVAYADERTPAKRMGPMSRHRAERVERGANINLDSDNFYTRIVEHDDAIDGRIMADGTRAWSGMPREED